MTDGWHAAFSTAGSHAPSSSTPPPPLAAGVGIRSPYAGSGEGGSSTPYVPFAPPCTSNPPMRMLRRVGAWAAAHTPAWLATLTRAGGGGVRHLCDGVPLTSEGDEAQATGDALVVLHLAGLLAVLEVVRLVRLSWRAKRRARAHAWVSRPHPHQQQQLHPQQELTQHTSDPGVTPSLAKVPGKSGVTLAPHENGSRTRDRVLQRGRRLLTYWHLVATTVCGGTRKEPSVSIAPDRILSIAAELSDTWGPAGAPIGQPTDMLLALPEGACFRTGVAGETVPGVVDGVAPLELTRGDAIGDDGGEWIPLYLLWTDTVRYTVNTDEIRKLLLSYPPSFYTSLAVPDEEEVKDGCEDAPRRIDTEVSLLRRAESTADGASSASPAFPVATNTDPATTITATRRSVRIAAVNLALVWRLTLVRRVYDALVMHADTERCAEDVEELAEYGDAVYRRCIVGAWQAAPPRSHDASPRQLVCAPAHAWLQLTFALDQLRRLSRRLMMHSVGSLFRYLYASSKSKCIAAGLLGVLTGLSGRVNAAGMAARQAITQVLGSHYDRTYSGVASGSRSGKGVRAVDVSGTTPAHRDVPGGGVTPCQDAHGGVESPAVVEDTYLMQVASLCAFELVRLAVNTILTASSKRFITVAAAERRDAVKAQLYAALTHMPLSFYDVHAYDEVELMVYFVNDLEGVDVHVHQHLFSAGTAFMALRDALRPLPREARVLVIGSVAVGYAVRGAGKVVARWWAQRCAHQAALAQMSEEPPASMDEHSGREGNFTEDPEHDGEGGLMTDGGGGGAWGSLPCEDVQEGENISSSRARDGVMLRGLEIIAALPQLRPYGADVALMAWWNRRVAHARGGTGAVSAGPAGVLRSLLGDETEEKLLPALGSAVLSLVDWLLPVLTATYGAHTAGCQRDNGPAAAAARLMDATRAVQTGIEAVVDARRVVDVVLHNAYKACVLERILSPRSWESTSAEDIARVERTASAHSWDDALVKPPPIALYRMFAQHQRADTYREAGAAAHSRHSYRDLVVTTVTVHELQFAYPSNPTVPVFARPFSARIQLQDPVTKKGRFVCLTGPSGQGKSTLLSLLLGLYTDYRGAGGAASSATRAMGRTGAGPAAVELALTYHTHTSPVTHTSPEDGLAVAPTEGSPAGPASDAEDRSRDSTRCTEASRESGEEHTYTVDLRRVPCNVLRGQLFSFVPQYPTIFAGATIAHNISLSPFVSLEETALLRQAQACADEARCDYIRRFPQGLLTPVGDGASGGGGGGVSDGAGLVRLSGGQAQRLMVARALYHGGGVLLMDEPTASLDSGTKAELLKEWRQLLDRRRIKGIICATHDEAVMAVADEVIALPTAS